MITTTHQRKTCQRCRTELTEQLLHIVQAVHTNHNLSNLCFCSKLIFDSICGDRSLFQCVNLHGHGIKTDPCTHFEHDDLSGGSEAPISSFQMKPELLTVIWRKSQLEESSWFITRSKREISADSVSAPC